MAIGVPLLQKLEGGYSSGRGTYQYKIEVPTTAMTDSMTDVVAAAAALCANAGYIITDVECDRKKEHPLRYDVTIKTSSMIWPDNQPVPTARASILTSSYEEFTEAYFEDNSPNPQLVLTSSFERFETFPQRKNGNPVLQVEKNFLFYSMVGYDEICFTTNTDVVVIAGTAYATDTLLFLPPLVQEMVENVAGIKYHYYKVTFRLAGDSGLHQDIIDDRGYFAFGSDGKLAKITLTDGSNEDITTPYPLDGTGHKKPTAGSQPASRTFKPYLSEFWGINFG